MKTLSALVLAASIALWSGPGEAALIASASFDGGGTIFAIDNNFTSTCGSPVVGPCQLPDQNPALGALTLGSNTAAGGDLDVQVSIQTADSGSVNRLDSTGTQFTNNGLVSHAFTVAIGATNFTGPSVEAFTTGTGQFSHLGGGYDGTVLNMRWFDDPANVQGALSPGVVQPGNLIDTFLFTPVANPASLAHNGGPFAVNDGALFGMTLQFDGVIGPGVRLTGREMTELKPQVVSNPSALFLMGVGMLWAAWSSRRRSS
jgi:hypothetical protein